MFKELRRSLVGTLNRRVTGDFGKIWGVAVVEKRIEMELMIKRPLITEVLGRDGSVRNQVTVPRWCQVVPYFLQFEG